MSDEFVIEAETYWDLDRETVDDWYEEQLRAAEAEAYDRVTRDEGER